MTGTFCLMRLNFNPHPPLLYFTSNVIVMSLCLRCCKKATTIFPTQCSMPLSPLLCLYLGYVNENLYIPHDTKSYCAKRKLGSLMKSDWKEVVKLQSRKPLVIRIHAEENQTSAKIRIFVGKLPVELFK